MSSVAPSMSSEGVLAENIVYFARMLRRAGLPIGPAKVIDALHAVQAVGLEGKDLFYFALSAAMVQRHEHQPVFDDAFRLFWQDPVRVGQQSQQLRELLQGLRSARKGKPPSQRAVQAMLPPAMQRGQTTQTPPPELTTDARYTVSARELLRHKDFASMSTQEWQEARRMVTTMRLPLPALRSRRSRPGAQGEKLDLRNSIKQMVRQAGDITELRYRRPVRHPLTLIILCDISGSMDSYTRMLLHFMHAVTNDRDRVYTFLFGTRLTNITRALRHRDADIALQAVTQQVADWSAGTRIGKCLKEFNQHWARRVTGQGAAVLLISDGLDSDAADGLDRQMAALKLHGRWLIWLNPLLRYDAFEAKPAGIRAMLPHVDFFLPAHNLQSLSELGAVLSAVGPRRDSGGAVPFSSNTKGKHYGNEQFPHGAGAQGGRLGSAERSGFSAAVHRGMRTHRSD